MKQWFVVQTKAGAEDKAAWHLHNQKYDIYLPRYRKQIRRAGKTQMALRPVFPGYLFVQIDMATQHWRSINGTIGVISLVSFGDYPQPIADAIIDDMRNHEQDGVVTILPEGFKRGDCLRVREGAFSGCSALLEEVSSDKRVILLLSMMGREVRIAAPMENLVKAS